MSRKSVQFKSHSPKRRNRHDGQRDMHGGKRADFRCSAKAPRWPTFGLRQNRKIVWIGVETTMGERRNLRSFS